MQPTLERDILVALFNRHERKTKPKPTTRFWKANVRRKLNNQFMHTQTNLCCRCCSSQPKQQTTACNNNTSLMHSQNPNEGEEGEQKKKKKRKLHLCSLGFFKQITRERVFSFHNNLSITD